jgi:uncharacterized protein (TIGR00661 family)
LKILFAIQGTGNGHISRARDILPLLQQLGETHTLISGIQADVDPGFEVHYRCIGLSFIFGKNGGIDLWKTFRKANLKALYREIKRIPVEQYDLVINDFEPVTAWACKLKNIPIIAVSHQWAVKHPAAPHFEDGDRLGPFILQHYAPAKVGIGFHFNSYAQEILKPVIRQQVRQLKSENKGHYLVYLPAYSDLKIMKVLGMHKDVEWHVFSKHTQVNYRKGNFTIERINNERFLESFRTCAGVLCGAGFEFPAEAIYLGKKLLVIPMKGQYEQQCNAAALRQLGVGVMRRLHVNNNLKIKQWINQAHVVKIDYPDDSTRIMELIKVYYQELSGKAWMDKVEEKRGRLVIGD